ncbi:Uncharacterised protein [Mycobacteroides abscessus subsp. abscessus]|nr:Uncharacterised protein [Mycobacteroides abscessus subsp. abscessus]
MSTPDLLAQSAVTRGLFFDMFGYLMQPRVRQIAEVRGLTLRPFDDQAARLSVRILGIRLGRSPVRYGRCGGGINLGSWMTLGMRCESVGCLRSLGFGRWRGLSR